LNTETTIKAKNFNQFEERVKEITNELTKEKGRGAANNFISNLNKIAAYRKLNINDIDLNKGLVEIDVLSVLSENKRERLKVSYNELGNDLLSGVSLKDINLTANKLEEVSIQEFQQKVNILENEINNKIKTIEGYISKTKNLLDSVSVTGKATIEIVEEKESNFKIAYINSNFINGSQFILDQVNVVFSVLDPNNKNQILASSPVRVSFDKRFEDERITFSKNNSQIAVGENVKVQVDITEGEFLNLESGVYSLTGRVVGIHTITDDIINKEQLIDGLGKAKLVKSKIVNYKKQVPQMFKSSFEK
jgi:hypothetical protein